MKKQILLLWVGLIFGSFLLTEIPAGAQAPVNTPLENLSKAFVELSKKIVPSVVNISTYASLQQTPFMSQEDFFKWFFEEHGMPFPIPQDPSNRFKRPNQKKIPEKERQPLGLGTGFIIDEKGLILTNHHVVGNADEIRIKFTEDENESPTQGEVIGRDPDADLALIQVKTKRKLVAAPLGDSDQVEVGEYVLAAGNPFGRGHSVSHGIISAKDRNAPGLLSGKYLQTDAPINPGNSGGPLVNLKGEVIGINNAIDARAQGIGFAIPINVAKKVLPDLKTKGAVDRGYIGVGVGELSPEIAEQIDAPKDLQAPFVTQVEPGKPADEAGVEPYDVILEFDGKKVTSASDLIRAVTDQNIGDFALLKILRKGKPKELKVKIAKRPLPFASRGSPDDSESEKFLPRKKQSPDKGSVSGLRLEASSQGVVVTQVESGSPAEQAGMLPGDVILEVDRKTIKTLSDFEKNTRSPKSYLVRVKRTGLKGQETFLVLILNLK